MKKKDAETIKVLTQLGLRQDQQLTPEQEQMLKNALDPQEDYLEKIKKLFEPTDK